MNLAKQLQELHDRATRGEQLSPAEQAVLQNQYNELDCAEDSLINQNNDFPNIAELREELNARVAEVSQIAAETERIARQNEIIRRENERLRQAVESRLLEKAA